MSDARERVRYALDKHGLSLTRGELDSVMRAFDGPKSKAKPAEDKPAAKAVEKPIAKPATYGKGKNPANHSDKKGS